MASRGRSLDQIVTELQREYLMGPRRFTENLSLRAIQQIAAQSLRVNTILNDWQNGGLGPKIARVNIPRAPLPASVAYRVVANVAIESSDGSLVWRPVQMDFTHNPSLQDVRDAADAVARQNYGRGQASPLPFDQRRSWQIVDIDLISIVRRT